MLTGPRRAGSLGLVRCMFLLLLFALTLPSMARAEHTLTSLEAVHEACESTRRRTRAELYVMQVEYRLGRYDEERARLYVDTRRNLQALDGHVSLLLSGLERVSFDVAPGEVSALRAASAGGATLQVGFFLGFDDSRRQPCVLRGAHAVTIVRADLAFAQLRAAGGERLARMETERLRAWRDDRAELAIPGEGPRGAVGQARFENGEAPPPAWQRALSASSLQERLGQCHAEGIARGAAREGQILVRLNVETRTGRVRRADVALSSLGDEREAACITQALGATALSPGPASWQAEVVDVSVPVRLVD